MASILSSVLTCPACGFQKELTMPTNACQFFYLCRHCNTRIKPKEGDCCVFCSYGSVPCPPIQLTQPNPNQANCCTALEANKESTT